MVARMPPSPRATASTSLGIGSEVITTSAPRVTSATDLAALAPSSVQVFTAAGFRSNTVTWWLLFLTMLRHIGPPMLPTPMNPTFTVSSPGDCDGRLYDKIGRAHRDGAFRAATWRGNIDARQGGRPSLWRATSCIRFR